MLYRDVKKVVWFKVYCFLKILKFFFKKNDGELFFFVLLVVIWVEVCFGFWNGGELCFFM